MRGIRLTIANHIRQSIGTYMFVFVLFIMGVIFGAVVVNALSVEQQQDLTAYMGSFFDGIDERSVVEPREAFRLSFINHLKYMGLIWILGLTVIGLPLILIFLFLKGVMIGFTVGFLVNQMGWKGALFSTVSVVPQNLLIIPAYLVTGVAAISFSVLLLKHFFTQRRAQTVWAPLRSYTVIVFFMSGVLLAASLYEAYVSPSLMRMVTNMM